MCVCPCVHIHVCVRVLVVLYFHEREFSHEICKNIVLRKFRTIQYDPSDTCLVYIYIVNMLFPYISTVITYLVREKLNMF